MIFEDIVTTKEDLAKATDAELAIFMHFVREEMKNRAGGVEREVRTRYAHCAQIDRIDYVARGYYVAGLDHAGKHVGVWKETAEDAIGAFLDETERRLAFPPPSEVAG